MQQNLRHADLDYYYQEFLAEKSIQFFIIHCIDFSCLYCEILAIPGIPTDTSVLLISFS